MNVLTDPSDCMILTTYLHFDPKHDDAEATGAVYEVDHFFRSALL